MCECVRVRVCVSECVCVRVCVYACACMCGKRVRDKSQWALAYPTATEPDHWPISIYVSRQL